MSAAAATAPADAAEAPKKKSRKLLFILVGVVLLAVLGAAGALFILKKNTADEFDDEHGEAAVEHSSGKARTPPTFMPMENMVVNLADAGGNRFVQLGLTLQLQDAKTGDEMKAYLPSIRSQVLVLISQRTADEMLQVQGKEKLAADIIEVIGKEMRYPAPKGKAGSPVQAVLFSSFIVQ